MDADFEIPARMRAARQLAGHKAPKSLAAAIDRRGYSAKVLYEIEQGKHSAGYAELAEIAHACGLPVEFFTADFSRLAEISEDPRKVIAQGLARAVARSEKRREDKPEDPPAPPGEVQKP